MTKEEALFSFWKSFGLNAFEENSVPTNETEREAFFASIGFPYITFQVVTGSFGSDVSMSASIWDRDRDGYSATSANNAKAKQIADYIGPNGYKMDIDGGSMFIKRGKPFAQNVSEPSDDTIKRKLLNVTVEYWTTN